MNLTCSSDGGSPSPQIKWYRDGLDQELDSFLVKGRNKDEPTKAILTIMPNKDIDGSMYKCNVWNRALGQKQIFETQTKVNVNCKYCFIILTATSYTISYHIQLFLECSILF